MSISSDDPLPSLTESGFDSTDTGWIDIIPAEIGILDEKGKIVMVNRAWHEFAETNHGTHETHWVGENYFEICERAFPDADIEAIVTGLRAVLKGDRDRFRTDYPCHAPDEERWFRLDACQFTIAGQPYLFMTHTNITERKLAEIRSDARLSQLETLVGVLSHDIRNPLNTITGYAGMLAEELGDDDRIRHIQESVTRISEITEATLSFVKAGALSEVEPVDLRDLVNDAWNTVDTKDATIEVVETLQFHGDRKLLMQLMENLIRNAVEHAGDDCSIRVGRLVDGFYVEDDGTGVPEEVALKTLDADFSTRGTGGLGLAICQAVARAHGGSLRISTAESGGARFEIADLDLALETPL